MKRTSKYRIKYKIPQFYLQEKVWFFFWKDVKIRTMKLSSVDERLLINTFENSFNYKVVLKKQKDDVINLVCFKYD